VGPAVTPQCLAGFPHEIETANRRNGETGKPPRVSASPRLRLSPRMSFFSTTEGPDLSRLDRSAQSFTLSTGAVRGLWDVTFDRNTKRFSYGSLDVTDLLGPLQKRAFASYDPTDDLNAAADADLLTREGRTVDVIDQGNWLIDDWLIGGAVETAADVKAVGKGVLETGQKAVVAAPETLKGLAGVLFGIAALVGLYLLWKEFGKR